MLRYSKHLLALAALSCMAIPSFASTPAEPVQAVTCEAPEYPSRSQKREEEGASVLRFLIRADGTVADSVLLVSSGSTGLDRKAANALSKCVFKRAPHVDATAELWMRVAYQWSLVGNDEDDGSMIPAKRTAALAAAKGDVDARYRLSLLLSLTAKTDAEHQQALTVLRSAADLGHALAQFDLGQHYEKGEWVKADLDEALRWYKKSAAQGEVLATQRLTLGILPD